MSVPPGLAPLYQTLVPVGQLEEAREPLDAPQRFAPDLGTPRRLLLPAVRPLAPWPGPPRG